MGLNVKEFSVTLEENIENNLCLLKENCPSELYAILQSICEFESKFLSLLRMAPSVDEDVPNYPDVQIELLIGAEEQWLQLTKEFAQHQPKDLKCLNYLWLVFTLADKSLHFYQQAAQNLPHPVDRLFYRSLAEVKKIFRHRVEGVGRVMYNDVWEKIGFAPATFGKE